MPNFWSNTAQIAIETAYVREFDLIDKFSGNELWGWGFNALGNLGINDRTHRSSPVQTVSGGTNWTSISSGQQWVAAIKTDGTLWAWGNNDYGELGLNNQTHRSSPVQEVLGATNWKRVSAGWYHAAAIRTDGTLWVWGHGGQGRIATASNAHRSSPIQVGALQTWKEASAGFSHTIGIQTDGTLWSFGENLDGEMGDGTQVHRSSPVQTVAGGTNWKTCSAGSYYSVAIKTDGTLWTWGYNGGGGLLGDGTQTHRSSPVQTIAGGSNWKYVDTGTYHTAAIKTDGTLWLWGQGTYGRLGDGTITNKSSPVQTVSGGTNWKMVSCGIYFTAAIKTDGTIWAWGHNTSGALGDGTNSVHRSSPVQSVAGTNNWKTIAAGKGNNHIVAITFSPK